MMTAVDLYELTSAGSTATEAMSCPPALRRVLFRTKLYEQAAKPFDGDGDAFVLSQVLVQQRGLEVEVLGVDQVDDALPQLGRNLVVRDTTGITVRRKLAAFPPRLDPSAEGRNLNVEGFGALGRKNKVIFICLNDVQGLAMQNIFRPLRRRGVLLSRSHEILLLRLDARRGIAQHTPIVH